MYYCIVEKLTTTPRKINCFGTYTHMCTATWLVKSRVKSKKTSFSQAGRWWQGP